MTASTMMYQPLLVSSILAQSAVNYPESLVVTRCVEGKIVEHSYREIYHRTCQLAQALLSQNVRQGERIGTLAWNTHRHLETYYAVSGLGAVVHTVNPRLYDEQIVYIINHAEDKILFVDLSFVDLLERIKDRLTTVETVIIMTDSEYMPEGSKALCYESLLAEYENTIQWPLFDECSAACLCYTSGTTGNPKGVMYSHRSTVLHALASAMPNALNLSEDTIVMPVVPMYHVSAWGIPYSGILCGATLVLPGAGMDGASLFEMIDYSKASLLLGVPTVWLNLLAYLDESGYQIPSVDIIAVGGAAAPKALVTALRDEHDIFLMPLWGMTETSPLASFARPNHYLMGLETDQRAEQQCTAGKNIWGIELTLQNEQGETVTRDGEKSGDLLVRGHWVCEHYYGQEKPQDAKDIWFETGDVATIDQKGYLRIVDRKKDVIKSGGEWISSIELENAALTHPDVQEACVVGVAHKKWDERPLLFVVLSESAVLDREAIQQVLQAKVAKWWLPDDIIALDSLPHTATGKLQKNTLREAYKNHYLEH